MVSMSTSLELHALHVHAVVSAAHAIQCTAHLVAKISSQRVGIGIAKKFKAYFVELTRPVVRILRRYALQIGKR